MTLPSASTESLISCTQFITRFDRNGGRPITLQLLRQVGHGVERRMRRAGARGSMVWRLTRTPSGMTVTAYWHPRRDAKIRVAQQIRQARQTSHRLAAREGIPNRRRLGSQPAPRMGRPAAGE